MRAISVSMSPSIAVEAGDLAGDPVGGQPPLAARSDGGRSGPAAAYGHRSAPCGNRGSGRPPTAAAPPPAAPSGAGSRDRVPSVGERLLVVGVARPEQAGSGGGARGSPSGCRRIRKSSSLLRHISAVERLEAMLLDRLDHLGRRAAPTSAVVPKVPSLMWRPARPAICAISAAVRRRGPRPSNLTRPAKATWSHVHVEAHADRVGGDEVIDLAGLVHRDLGVAGARAERAHHHGGAAALAAHQSRRCDRPRAAEKATTALRGGSRVSLLRRRHSVSVEKRGRRDDLRLGHQPAHHRPDGLRAEQHRLLAAAGVEQPVGEDMAALGIGRRAGPRRWRGSRPAGRAASIRRCRRNSAAPGGRIFSSPVTSATAPSPLSRPMRS